MNEKTNPSRFLSIHRMIDANRHNTYLRLTLLIAGISIVILSYLDLYGALPQQVTSVVPWSGEFFLVGPPLGSAFLLGCSRGRSSLAWSGLVMTVTGSLFVAATWLMRKDSEAARGVSLMLYVYTLVPVGAVLGVMGSLAGVLGKPLRPGYCAVCGYDLTGLPEPRCPECGTPFDPSLLTRVRSHGTRNEVSDE